MKMHHKSSKYSAWKKKACQNYYYLLYLVIRMYYRINILNNVFCYALSINHLLRFALLPNCIIVLREIGGVKENALA